MSRPKTTADLFRERGWVVGTKITREPVPGLALPLTILAFSSAGEIATEDANGRIASLKGTSCVFSQWSLYTPTPPIPTREEWAELWAKLKAFRNLSDARVHQYGHGPVLDLMLAIDAIGAKVQP